MSTKSPTYLTRVAELKATKALAQRYPGMASAIKPYVTAEAAALDLTGKSIEELVRLGVGHADVEWGAREDWENSTDDSETWISCQGMVEYRLGISSDGRGGFYLTYLVEDSWRSTKHIKTAKGLISAVARWSRG